MRRLGIGAALLLAAAAHASAADLPPKRIASLNLAADEVLVDLLPRGRLVAVTAFADDEGTSNIVGRVPRSVTRFEHANLERLVALQPDLVVVSDFTDADFLNLLRASGLRTHRMAGFDSIDGVRRGILDLGGVVGEETRAREIVGRFDAGLQDLARRLAGVTRPRVLYWSDPYTAGKGTMTGQIIEAAGGVNAGAEMGVAGVLPIGAERAFIANPDVVLVVKSPTARTALLSHPLLSRLAAVGAGRVVEVPGRFLLTVTHHVAEGAWSLAHALHPERVPEAGP